MKEKLKQSWFSLLVIAITIVTWLIALPFYQMIFLCNITMLGMLHGVQINS